jgi:hypothetical protein
LPTTSRKNCAPSSCEWPKPFNRLVFSI